MIYNMVHAPAYHGNPVQSLHYQYLGQFPAGTDMIIIHLDNASQLRTSDCNKRDPAFFQKCRANIIHQGTSENKSVHLPVCRNSLQLRNVILIHHGKKNIIILRKRHLAHPEHASLEERQRWHGRISGHHPTYIISL